MGTGDDVAHTMLRAARPPVADVVPAGTAESRARTDGRAAEAGV